MLCFPLDIPSDWFLSQLRQQVTSCLLSRPHEKNPANFGKCGLGFVMCPRSTYAYCLSDQSG